MDNQNRLKKFKEKVFTRSMVKVSIFCMLCMGFMYSSNKLFYLNVSASMPIGIYARIPGDSYRVGDIVTYHITDDVLELSLGRGYLPEDDRGIMKMKDAMLVKTIGALAGDTYGVDGRDEFFINGKKVGGIDEIDSQGRRMPVQRGKHVVEDGKFLPYAKPVNSLDGRYIGTVPLDRIECRLVPIITTWGE